LSASALRDRKSAARETCAWSRTVSALRQLRLIVFWPLLKRGVVGTYHQVSEDYLPLDPNEFSFRHNFRKRRRIRLRS
jgi:hypothetical protein